MSCLIRTVLVGSVALLLGLPVGADDSNPAPAYFADGLSAQSSWDQIRKKSGIQTEFPFLGFGNTFVALPAVCLDGETLRMRRGGRLSAAERCGQGDGLLNVTGAKNANATDLEDLPPGDVGYGGSLRPRLAGFEIGVRV